MLTLLSGALLSGALLSGALLSGALLSGVSFLKSPSTVSGV
ncbi:pentapeptide repeat-containing protein [Methanobacterium ferruginis]